MFAGTLAQVLSYAARPKASENGTSRTLVPMRKLHSNHAEKPAFWSYCWHSGRTDCTGPVPMGARAKKSKN